MSKYNKYINNFANEAEYETYIDSSIAETPNTALIDDTGKMIYTKILPNNYIMFGTTTGTQDFKIGGNSIQIHVVVEDDSGVNKMYVSSEDVLNTVTNFSYGRAFSTTEGNKILSIKKWKIDTSNVTEMEGMFDSCSKLTILDLTNFNTSKVTRMDYMFQSCTKLTTLDLTSFDTTKTTNIFAMFSSSSSLNKLYLSSSFFNSTSMTTYDFSVLHEWTDTESLAMFVEAVTAHDGTGKKVYLTSNTKNALTTDQKTAITNAGWTIA